MAIGVGNGLEGVHTVDHRAELTRLQAGLEALDEGPGPSLRGKGKSPEASRTNQGCGRRMPQSVRLIVVA